jgi:hypothetical protein
MIVETFCALIFCVHTEEFETSFPRMQQNQNQAMDLGPNSLDIQLTRPNERPLKELMTIKKEWLDQNKDTFISYSCSEGLYPKIMNSKLKLNFMKKQIILNT